MEKMQKTAKQDRVPTWEKMSLGVGAFSAYFGYAAVGILAYPVYNMKLHVEALWIGMALMVPRLWDAFSDPLMGFISDNFHSRLGRRRPFIVSGAIGMGILFASIWYVPENWGNVAKISYFIILQLIYYTFYTIFSVPYNALTYEMSPDYNERNRVMAFNAFFHKAGEFLGGWMLPLATLFGLLVLGDGARNDKGEPELTMVGIHWMVWAIGLIVMAAIGAIPGLFVRERFKRITKDQEKVKLLSSAKQAFSSAPFVILVSVIVFNTLSGVLAAGLDQYVLVYFMNDGNEAAGFLQKAILTSGYAIMGFASIPVITWLANKLGKKGSLYFVYSLMVVGGVMKWFIFTPGHTIYKIPFFGLFTLPLDPYMLVDPLLCGPMWVAVKIMLASMMADICDEDELKHGSRREGIFSAVFSWVEKMVLSLAFLGTAVSLFISGFDPKLGAEQAAGTFTKMRLCLAGAPAITAVFAIIALYFYPLTAKRAAEVRRQLEERRGVANLSQDNQQ